MKSLPLLLAGACALPSLATAQALNEPATARHHFGVSVPVWLKARGTITASRATNPGPAPGAPPTAADGRVDRTYDDGFVGVNSAGNPALGPGGTPVTSYFGYQNNTTQVGPGGVGANLALHSVTLNGGDYTRSLENQPFPGLEFNYRYDWKAGQKWALSWELAAGYQWFNWEQRGAPNATANVLTDLFALNGVALPTTSYPGALNPTPFTPNISSTPVRSEANVAAAVAGKRQLQLHTLQLRVAPELTWTLTPRWHVGLQAGLALGVGLSQLSYAEQITVADPAVPTLNASGRTTDAHFWAGLFSQVRVSRQLGEHWTAHVEVRHLLTAPLQHSAPARAGTMNLSDGLGIGASLSRPF
jgi:hypothetical protein